MGVGRTTGTVSGAAQGAAIGSTFGPWGAAAGGVVGGIAGFISGSSADAQQESRQAWANYNVAMQYNTDIFNVQAQYGISAINAAAVVAAANAEAEASLKAAQYNVAMIAATTHYESLLLEEELSRVWEQEGLDLLQLEQARARERGNIVADQAASGTVIGEGSNAEVIINQKTQEAMDALVIQTGANHAAADIANQKAQGLWMGEVAIQQTMWEGQMAAHSAVTNANIRSASIMGGAAIQAQAGAYTAAQRQYSGQIGIINDQSAYNAQQTQNLISGLFSAGGIAASAYFANKPVSTPTPSPTPRPTHNPPAAGRAYRTRPALTSRSGTSPGTSLIY